MNIALLECTRCSLYEAQERFVMIPQMQILLSFIMTVQPFMHGIITSEFLSTMKWACTLSLAEPILAAIYLMLIAITLQNQFSHLEMC